MNSATPFCAPATEMAAVAGADRPKTKSAATATAEPTRRLSTFAERRAIAAERCDNWGLYYFCLLSLVVL
eukprot:CAMPEP_0204026168 /NCGR_PEP_ID=MMETSP0360-20130528/44788_1 /ASSEMBLY_ACC=CAM_ASM_000342 /TAXON_ID=268821 /ORGANISM="Scrippsiella Hangoei, Strain SHTV-5" /LENGTH=69 /DNA_ID=CAMNT_0050969777 /DNA_START=14 /DNA_END=220 /DNA_ORIENTATION=+